MVCRPHNVIVLLGPTGIGKTQVSLLLAQHLGSEIISADSMQVYRHMDIGTAKPSAAERLLVRHHMIDVVNPWERFSTGEYISAVVPIIDRLHAQTRVPLVVGGTGLYIKAMTRGIFSGPSADWDLRAELLKTEQASPRSLYSRLRLLDPEAAERIAPSDTRRIVRALEVSLASDATISSLHREHTRPLPYLFTKIGLMRQRSDLYRDIDARVDAMIAKGLVAEVGRVSDLIVRHLPSGGVSQTRTSPLPSMQAIGYKEIALYLAGETDREEAIALVKKRTRNYAKRQFTWFRKEPGISWIDVTGIGEPRAVFEKVLALLEQT